ncbi:MAG: DUF6273 domain-containing protein [Oscillospiraceae bacterium]|nr:DUF6273 domain-containing protein [Oscillospiraceae bacterium]
MKCNKCGEKVAVQPGKSANFCSNCGNKIEAEKSKSWKYFDNTKELLEYVAAEYGNDVLFGRKYFSDHTSTMMSKGQKNILNQAFDCGAAKILQNNITADQANKEIAVKQAVKKLTELMFSQEAAEQIIWEFTNAIGWGMVEPKSSIPTPPPQPQPQPQQRATPTAQSAAAAPGVGALMTRAWQFAEDGDWKDSADYFNKVLDIDPSYAPAFLGLLCVELKVSKEDKLANAQKPTDITNHKYYKRAVTDPAIKSQLDGYIQIINARINAEQKAAAAEAERKRRAAEEAARRKRVQDAFDNATKVMNSAQSTDDYRKAITAFASIDSNYQDINSQIKGKIAWCEQKKVALETEFQKKYGFLLDRFSAEGRAQTAQRREAAQAQLDEENKKAQADVEAKCAQIRQKFDSDYKIWRDKYNHLKAAYEAEYKKWESEVTEIKSRAEQWKSKGLCPHCGGTFKGLLTKKCSECGKTPSEPIRTWTSSPPTEPNYPAEPRMPQMPIYTPRRLGVETDPLSDVVATIKGEIVFVKLGGIDWRVLTVENNRALLISKKILEKRPYNIENTAITWEACTLRTYLNGEFYNKLGSAKSAIVERNNSNPNNQWYGTAGGNATKDKVFLLSLDEVCRYFGDSTAELQNVRKVIGGFSDKNSPNRIAKDSSGMASSWTLRSPGLPPHSAAFVRADGEVFVGGSGVGGVGGVRPALWLNLQQSNQQQPPTPIYIAPQPAIQTPQKTITRPTPVIGSIHKFGKYDWRVLDVQNGQALLISKDVTHVNKPYNETNTDVTWESCTLRQWLNRDFLNEFSAQKQAQICLSTIPNEDNQWYGIEGGKRTTDRIFLLSLSEVVRYFGDSGGLAQKQGNGIRYYMYDNGIKRIAKPDLSKWCWFGDGYDNERKAKFNNKQAWWWLRSPGIGSYRAAGINSDGYVRVNGIGVLDCDAPGGVRPALWLNLNL